MMMVMMRIMGPRLSASASKFTRARTTSNRHSFLTSLRALNRDTRVSCFVKEHSLDLAIRGCQDGA